MKAFYLRCDPNQGCASSHSWLRNFNDHRFTWFVVGMDQFTSSGPCVVDDFGNLIQVPYL